MDFGEYKSFGIVNWKWIGLAAGLVLGWLLRPLIRVLFKNLKGLFKHLQDDPHSFWSHLLALNIEKPLASILVGVLWAVAVDSLEFPEKLAKYLHILVSLWLAIHIITLCYRMVDAIGYLMGRWALQTTGTGDDQLVSFAKRSLQVVVVILGVLVFLQNAGVNVMALLAGLSLGGIALALAAQDTFANLFGSITIFFDRPFKIGDHVRIGGAEGIVEEIGFRSTRIRSLASTLITIPNSTVAKEIIDNWGVRQSRRVRFTVGLHYDTPAATIEKFCDGIKYYLKNDKMADPATVYVSFINFGASTLDVLIQCYTYAKDYDEELSQLKALNFEIMKVAKDLNIDFAYPTQTVYYKNPTAAT